MRCTVTKPNQGLNTSRSRSDWGPSGKEGMWLLHSVASTSSTCSLFFSLSPSFPSNHGAHLENKLRQSECNLLLVTARVSRLASLPLSLFLSLFFTSLLSLFTSGLNYSTPVCLWFVLSEIHVSLERLHCSGKLHGGVGGKGYKMHLFSHLFVPSSRHCFIKNRLSMISLNIRSKHMCVGVCVYESPAMSYMVPLGWREEMNWLLNWRANNEMQ